MHVQLVISVSILLSWVQMGILKSRFVLDYTCDCCIDIKENWMLIHFLYDLGYILIIKNKLIFVCFDALSFFFFGVECLFRHFPLLEFLICCPNVCQKSGVLGKVRRRLKQFRMYVDYTWCLPIFRLSMGFRIPEIVGGVSFNFTFVLGFKVCVAQVLLLN